MTYFSTYQFLATERRIEFTEEITLPVENAVKIARRFRQSAIVLLSVRFMVALLSHGTDNEEYKTRFGPFSARACTVPIEHRRISEAVRSAELFKADVEPEQVAAIIIERCRAVVSTSPQKNSLALRALCDKHGIFVDL